MSKDRTSKLVPYSLGIVIEDKALDSDLIKVFPVEELPFVDGKVADHKPKYDVSLPDAGSVARKTELEGDAALIARWLPYGHSNRITSPDVVKNETVLLFRYADTDKYYWTTIFREPKIRRLETVCYMFGDLKTPLKAWDKSSSYWMEVSTHKKKVQLHTSRSDGEAFSYDVIIDAKAGSMSIQDDAGNRIKMNSGNGQVSIDATANVVINAPKIFLNGDVLISGGTSMSGGGSATSITAESVSASNLQASHVTSASSSKGGAYTPPAMPPAAPPAID